MTSPTWPEQELATAFDQLMQSTSIEPDGLLREAMAEGRVRRRRHRAGQLAVVAAVACLVALAGGLGLHASRAVDQPRDAQPAATTAPTPTASTPAVWPPAVEDVPSDSRIHGRVAALYLGRLAGATPSYSYGTVWPHEVHAALDLEGYGSTPFDAQRHDLWLLLESPQTWDDPVAGPAGSFGCTGAFPGCRLDRGRDGTLTMTWTPQADQARIRGGAAIAVRYLRPDRTVVEVTGRSDVFTTEELTAVATSPMWDLTKTPDAADRRAAEELSPYSTVT